jgi:hypothetical protein
MKSICAGIVRGASRERNVTGKEQILKHKLERREGMPASSPTLLLPDGRREIDSFTRLAQGFCPSSVWQEKVARYESNEGGTIANSFSSTPNTFLKSR